jgi:glycosyltransferase involved in cell wall biosynthesis
LEYLGAVLESIHRQTYPHVEIIVVDDDSGEESRVQLQQLLTPEVTLLRHPERRGQGGARNTGIRHARGQYIAFLDSDDLWLPEKLAAQVRILREHPEAGLTYCGFTCIDEADQPLRKQHESWHYSGWTFPRMMQFCFIKSPSTTLIPREVLLASGLFDERFKAAEDWELWLRLTRQFPIIADPTIHTLYRIHSRQISRSRVHCRQCDVEVREKWLDWAQREAPEWETLARHYYARDLQKLARAQAIHTRDIPGAYRTLARAQQVNPRDWRVYTRLLQLPLYAISRWR